MPRTARLLPLLILLLVVLTTASPASAAAPLNDAFAAAELLEGASDTATGTTVESTKEPGEPNHAGYSSSRSVWYRWVAPGEGVTTVSIEGSEYATTAAVYTGLTVDGLTQAASADGYSGSRRLRFTVVPGRTYFIAVGSRYSTGGAVAIALTHGPRAPNDDLAQATVLTGSSATATGSNVGATREPGEPSHGYGAGRSVWWTWTAPADGGVLVDTTASGIATMLAAYTGATVSGLVRVPTSSSSYDQRGRLTFRAVAGVTYRIVVDGDAYGTAEGPVSLALTLSDPPANDAFASATDLGSERTASVSGSTHGSGLEEGEPAHVGPRGSVWYSWTAPSDGSLSIVANRTAPPAVVAYTGSRVSELTRLVAQTDSARYGRTRVRVEEGVTYRIAVAEGPDSEGATAFALTLTLVDRPANDDFADAETLEGSSDSATGTTVAATREVGEPSHSWASGNSAWFAWTAPSDGALKLDTAGSGFATVLAVYTGDALPGLVRLDSRVSYGTPRARMTLRVVAGTSYRIAVDGYYGAHGAVQLSLALGPLPPNDDFASATELASEDDVLATGTNDGASVEIGEPSVSVATNARQTVWYRWTATKRGSLTIRAEGAPAPSLAAFTGTQVAGLTRVSNQAQDYSGGLEQIRVRVEAGVEYRIMVSSRSGETGTFNLSLEVIPRPLNDDFADAQLLTGLSADAAGTNLGATQEPGEPIHEENYRDPSVWFTWTAPATVGVTLDTAGSTFDTVVAVYTGDSVGALTRVPSTPARNTTRVKRRFRAVAGVTYRIAVDGAGARQGAYVLALRTTAPPANDHFAAAQVLAGTAPEATGDTIAATGEGLEPSEHGGTAGASVWYRWTAPSDGDLTVSLPVNDFAGVLGVYTGTELGALTKLPKASWDTAGYRVTSGQTYAIAVHGGTTALRGEFSLRLQFTPPPPNDLFADAQQIAAGVPAERVSNARASRETGEPTHCCGSGARSVWYAWTAPTGGRATVDLAGTSFDWVSAVYTGDAVGSLTRVTSADYDALSFTATAGTTYRIAVDSYSSGTGPIDVKLELTPPPPNDAFADAELLTGPAPVATGDTAIATREVGEPSHMSSKRSIWYRWTATSTGRLKVDLGTSAYGTVGAVYSGETLATLVKLGEGSHHDAVYAPVRAGETYRIAVASWATEPTGPTRIALTHEPAPLNDDFASPATLSGTTAEATGSTTTATAEPGEPEHRGQSVWYEWTAPATGQATIDMTGSVWNRRVTVYTGDALTGLTRVGDGYTSAVFAVRTGKTYRVAVDRDSMSSMGGTVKMKLALTPAPPNDDFGDAIELTGEQAAVTASTRLATTESVEPPITSWAAGGSSIWYRWTAPASGRATIDLAGSEYGWMASVSTGDGLASLTRVAQSANVPLSVPVTAGRTYRIAVGSYYSYGGSVKLALALHRPPANDDFADAEVLEGPDDTATGDTTNATRQDGEPRSHHDSSGGPSVWYRWTAPRDGRALLDLTGSTLTWAAGVYTGDGLGSLVRVTGGDAPIQIRARAGVTYLIAIDSAAGAGAPLKLRLSMIDAPANDDFADATVLRGPFAEAAVTTLFATTEGNEPFHGPTGSRTSVWYRWRAPAYGMVTVEVSEADFAPAVSAYRGDALDAPLDGQGRGVDGELTFQAFAGVVYRIAVDSVDGRTGAARLALRMPRAPHDDIADARELSGTWVEANETNAGATAEDGEPARAGRPARSSVWFRWTAPVDGTLDAQGFATASDSVLGIYTGGSVPDLKEVAAYGDGGAVSFIRTPVTAGTTYLIALDSSGDDDGPSQGPVDLRLNLVPAPPPATEPKVVTTTPSGDPRPASRAMPAPVAPSAPKPTTTTPAAPKPAPAPAAALKVTLDAGPQWLPDVLARGVRADATCSRACTLEATVTVAGGQARGASRMAATAVRAGRDFTVRLNAAAKKRLRTRSATLVVTVVARSGGETATATRRVTLRR